MNKNHIIIIILLIIIFALIGGIFFISNAPDMPVIYNNTIPGVGTFNTTNVTNFTLSSSSNDLQTDYLANDSISQITTSSSSLIAQNTKEMAERVNDSAKGHTIYKDTANIGEHKGEVRYFSILEDMDKGQYIMVSTGDYNLTCMIVDSFKIF